MKIYNSENNFFSNKNLKQEKVKNNSSLTFKKDVFQKKEKIAFKGTFDNKISLHLSEDFYKETTITAFINVLSDKTNKFMQSYLLNAKISDVFSRMPKIEVVLPIFYESGIYKVGQLQNFAKLCNKTPQSRAIYSNQKVQAVKIYGKLTNKTDLAEFPDILLYLYSREAEKKEPDFDVLNRYTDFLKKLGVNKSLEFEEKFAYLKPKFNDFEDILSKIEAIDYLRNTYDRKITFLADILKQSEKNSKKDPEKVYSLNSEIIDYFYDKNNGESLDGLSEIIDISINQKNIKSKSLQLFGVNDEGFAGIESKIKFYRLLYENNISVDDFNKISSKSFIEGNDSDILKQIINKNFISGLIKDAKGISEKEASDFYIKFSDVINAVFDEEEGNTDYLKLLIKLVDKFNIKNSDGFLRLYNEFTCSREKTLTKDKFKSFIELFNYCSSFDIFDLSKKQKKPLIDILLSEKNKFYRVKDEIEEFINSSEGTYFAGESALNIYKKYYSLFQDEKVSVRDILGNISKFDIRNSVSYQEKINLISSFVSYFEYEEVIRFINENKISSDNDPKNDKYKNNCLKILDMVNNSGPPDLVESRLNYYLNSGFLLKSKEKLDEFFSKVEDDEKRKEILALIADKKIPSITALGNFIREYSETAESNDKIISYLKNLPEDVDFEACNKLLGMLKAKIISLELPLKINAHNICCVDMKKLLSSPMILNNTLIEIINRIHGVSEDSNFISALPNSKTQENSKYSAKNIAEEIVFKMNKSSESYQNIIRLLKIDKKSLGLDDNISDYLYIRALIEILPKEFIEFVNSDDWLKYPNEDKFINLTLHAKLRAIDRLILDDVSDISELYLPETKEKLRSILNAIYNEKPFLVKGSKYSQRIIENHKLDSDVIETIFAPTGELITLYERQLNQNLN